MDYIMPDYAIFKKTCAGVRVSSRTAFSEWREEVKFDAQDGELVAVCATLQDARKAGARYVDFKALSEPDGSMLAEGSFVEIRECRAADKDDIDGLYEGYWEFNGVGYAIEDEVHEYVWPVKTWGDLGDAEKHAFEVEFYRLWSREWPGVDDDRSPDNPGPWGAPWILWPEEQVTDVFFYFTDHRDEIERELDAETVNNIKEVTNE